MPGTGSIEGIIDSPHIEFVKRMPVCYMAGPDGHPLSLGGCVAIACVTVR
jgi:hypothetical protein